jgi:intraflagellar transport protein 140
MKTIINFYQKAKAFESLGGFYDACAQVEIDEYRDYEKALGAMKEAQRQLEKSTAQNKEMK